MHCDYQDIRERIGTEPEWFDEHAVPRYCLFEPGSVANIYATEAALLEVTCQSCERVFHVAQSWSDADLHLHRLSSLTVRVAASSVEYGDPPNVDCCPAGPTMNSVPRRVLQFWRRRTGEPWTRDPSLEVALHCRWFSEEDL